MSESDMQTIIILNTSDGSKHKVSIRLSQSLNDLKTEISKCSSLSAKNYNSQPILPKHQRIFHLGRELKTGKRSLDALGIGNHGVFLIHLLSTQPKIYDLLDDDNSNINNNNNNNNNNTVQHVVNLLGSPSPPQANKKKSARQKIPDQHDIVDLLDSSSDEDEEDKKSAPKKKRVRRH